MNNINRRKPFRYIDESNPISPVAWTHYTDPSRITFNSSYPQPHAYRYIQSYAVPIEPYNEAIASPEREVFV